MFFILDKPLVGEHRLDHNAGAVAARHHQFVFFIFDQQACSSRSATMRLRASANDPCPDRRSGARSLIGVEVKMLIGVQVVALAHLIIVEIVPG